jgi:hypothetical protein
MVTGDKMKEAHVIEALNKLMEKVRYTKIKYNYEVKIQGSNIVKSLNII